jgi:hypothetical protein
MAANRNALLKGNEYMKKILFFGVFLLISTVLVVAQVADTIYTSEGAYAGVIDFVGKNCGQREYEYRVTRLRLEGDRISTDVKLSRGQLECVRSLLNRYEHSRGDTFSILMHQSGMGAISYLTVLCEFTSDTQFSYWVFRNDR